MARFWGLFVASQGGVLSTFSPDPVLVFDNARSGRTQVVNAPVFNPADTEVIMRSWFVEVAHLETLRKPTVNLTNVVVQTNVVFTTNVWVRTNQVETIPQALMPRVDPGNTGIGIGWTSSPRDRVDLDLYVHVPRDGGELSYKNPRTATGRYFRDITQSLQANDSNWRSLWEFVELDGDQLPREVWIHMYHGRGPVSGEVRIQHQGREHAIPFVFPAARRVVGLFGGRRHGSDRWIRVDLTPVHEAR